MCCFRSLMICTHNFHYCIYLSENNTLLFRAIWSNYISLFYELQWTDAVIRERLDVRLTRCKLPSRLLLQYQSIFIVASGQWSIAKLKFTTMVADVTESWVYFLLVKAFQQNIARFSMTLFDCVVINTLNLWKVGQA